MLEALGEARVARADLLAELPGITDPALLTSGHAAKLNGKLPFVVSHFEGRYVRNSFRAFGAPAG